MEAWKLSKNEHSLNKKKCFTKLKNKNTDFSFISFFFLTLTGTEEIINKNSKLSISLYSKMNLKKFLSEFLSYH